ncbi:hypothetical protein DYH10_01555 [Candidatus Saccharibacteria bacterium CPR2]|nr:hypothetical protein [Candidatus Saccharibacteria bacterium CPR2]
MKKLTISSNLVSMLVLFSISFLAISINMAVNPSRVEAAGHRVWACGFYPNSIDEFIGTIYDRLYNGDNNVGGDCGTGYSTDEQYMSGAAFIMLNMLNGKSDHITVANVPEARERFAEWEAKVRYVASIGGVNLNWVNYGYGENSLWDDATLEDRYYGENGSADSIVFDLPGIMHIAIKKYCANLVAVAGRLPEPGNFDLTPTINNMPATAVRGQNIDVASYVTNNGSGPSILSDRLGVLVARFVGYAGSEVLNPNPMWSNQVIPQGATWSFGGPITIPSNATLGSTFCVVLRVNPGAGQTYGPRTDNLRWDAACTRIVDKPFVHVNDGDVFSGARFNVDSNGCSKTSSTVGLIKSQNYNIGGNIFGSKDEYALTALGAIDNFGSANNPTSGLLKFANNPSPEGFFDNLANRQCLPDYYDKFDDGATEITANDFNNGIQSITTSGIYKLTGGTVKISNFPSPSGATPYRGQVIMLVDAGDLILDTDMQYADIYGITDPSQIPYFMVIVKGGNIIVKDSITNIDGIFITMPRDKDNDGDIDDSNEGGYFNTCGVPSSFATPLRLSTSTCNQPLTINGAVMAHKILLNRTRIDGPPNYQPAEIINLHPEMYFSSPLFNQQTETKGLGPTRSVRDLPPVY